MTTNGFSYYCAAEFHSDGITSQNILVPNETTYIDITLHRFVDKNIFRFDPATEDPVNFKRIKPIRESINNG